MSRRATGKQDELEHALRRGRAYARGEGLDGAAPAAKAEPSGARKGTRAPAGEAAAAARRLTGRIAAEGLADVSYAPVDSPFGTLLLAATKRGLVRLAFPEESVDATLGRLAAKVSPRIVEAFGPLDAVRRELDEYFDGRRRRFDLPLDWTLVGPFGRRVLDVKSEIHYGSVLSYSEVAAEAGSPRGSRAAGNALGANPIPIVVPCHRVLRRGGALGGYGGGLPRKQFLLELEGAL
jgi:methylated-DNA-[protein]-cysteine S-methyltransferase